MNKVCQISILLLSMFVFTTCLKYDESDEELDKSTTIYVGAIHSFTGVFASQGVEVEQAADLAISQINKKGGVLGKNIALLKRDTGAQPDICTQHAKDLIKEEGVKYIFGAIESACTNAILDVAVPAGALTVTGNPYASTLSLGRDNKGLFFRTSPNNAKLMESLASKIVLDGNTSLTIISSDNYLTATSGDDMIKYFEALDCGGYKCKINKRFDYSGDIDPETYNFSKKMKEIMKADSDAIFFNGYPDDGVGFLRAAIDAGYKGTPYISAEMGHASIGEFLDSKTAESIQWVDVTPSSGPSFKYFKKEYEKAYNEKVTENRVAERSYDIIMLLALAIHKAGKKADINEVSTALYEIANPPGELVYADEYKNILDMIKKGIDVDYSGASGPCDFNDYGDVPLNVIFMGYSAKGEHVEKY